MDTGCIAALAALSLEADVGAVEDWTRPNRGWPFKTRWERRHAVATALRDLSH